MAHSVLRVHRRRGHTRLLQAAEAEVHEEGAAQDAQEAEPGAAVRTRGLRAAAAAHPRGVAASVRGAAGAAAEPRAAAGHRVHHLPATSRDQAAAQARLRLLCLLILLEVTKAKNEPENTKKSDLLHIARTSLVSHCTSAIVMGIGKQYTIYLLSRLPIAD